MPKITKPPKPKRRPRAAAFIDPPPAAVAPRAARRPGVATLTAYVSPELARSLRIRAAEDGTTSSSIIGAALAAHLGAR